MSEPSVSTSIAQMAPSEILSRTGRFIEENSLIGTSDRVLCMVSGGADSVAMLHILHSLAKEGKLAQTGTRTGAQTGTRAGTQTGTRAGTQTGTRTGAQTGTFSLGICHVNYGRRGSASDEDEDFVRRLGDELGVRVHAVRAPAEDRSNYQAWARDFRYLAAQNLCKWQGYNRIAVGHNQDDRVETMLYRLITYSGRRSLVVMPPRRGRVIRPLLFLSSGQIRNFCADAGMAFREDESNQMLGYVRNRIRHQVIPRLEEIRPDFRERLLDTLDLLTDEEEVLKAVADAAWEQTVVEESDSHCLDAVALAGLPRATARLVVRRWLACLRDHVRISRKVLDGTIDLCRDTSGSRVLSLAGGLQVERRYDRLLLLDFSESDDTAAPTATAIPVPGRVTFGDYVIEAVESPPWELDSGDPLTITIDAGRLAEPLVVRPWREGERFTPLGLKGSKSVQDLMVDEKVPRAERKKLPLVTCGDDVVWVCGLRMSEGFRVTEETVKTVGLKARRRTDDNQV